MKTVVVDYGMGNLGSVRRSLEECGADVTVSNDPRELEKASSIVLPGVGSFKDGMRHLEEKGLAKAIQELSGKQGVPLLGICLGMQLLGKWGEEGGRIPGLGLIAGEVKRLKPSSLLERIPHVGWNEVNPRQSSPLFENIPTGTDFYFIHSYGFIPDREEDIAATTLYCGKFVSAVAARNIYGVQFHPEKSSKNGFQLLKNFLNVARVENAC